MSAVLYALSLLTFSFFQLNPFTLFAKLYNLNCFNLAGKKLQTYIYIDIFHVYGMKRKLKTKFSIIVIIIREKETKIYKIRVYLCSCI